MKSFKPHRRKISTAAMAWSLWMVHLMPAHCQTKSDFSLGFESNMQYYTDDPKTGEFNHPNRFRSNSYLKLDYSLGKFYAGVQGESYEPMALLNYSPYLDQVGLGLYYAGYKSKKIDITGGYFYEQFGSGLILRFWEDRQLGINNALRGGRVKYSPIQPIQLIGLYGRQRYGFNLSEGNIFGFDSNIDLSSLLKTENFILAMGMSYVGRSQKRTISQPNFSPLTHAYSMRLNFANQSIDVSAEYVWKSKDAVVAFDQVVNAKTGHALLLNFSYSQRGLGISTDIRKIENMTFYSNRQATNNPFNDNIINYIPALTKQHDYLLTNIYVYPAQPGVSFAYEDVIKLGEIGGQIDIFYNIKKKTALGGRYGTKMSVNASYWTGLKGETDFRKFDYEADVIGFGVKYFSEVSWEMRKKWSKKWDAIFYYVSQSYNRRHVEERIGKINTDILVGSATYKMRKSKSLRMEAQHLWTSDDRKNWAGATLEFAMSSKIGFYVSDIYNYGSEKESDKIHYYNVGATYTKGANRLSINYGRQRGGLVCVGGVCRMVPESTGASASLIILF